MAFVTSIGELILVGASPEKIQETARLRLGTIVYSAGRDWKDAEGRKVIISK
jgi:hypothetical protein